MKTITGRKYSYTKQQPNPLSLRPIQVMAKQRLVETMFLRQPTTIILSMPLAVDGEIKLEDSWKIPDRRLAVRRHSSSRERTT
jgi:hypothetical protein